MQTERVRLKKTYTPASFNYWHICSVNNHFSTFETYYLIKMRKITILSLLLLLCFTPIFGQRAKDGNKTITASAVIVNEYTALAADANTGDVTVTVANNNLNTNSRFAAALSPGDLVMIIQMQGATIDATLNDATYGAVTNLNNCGKYELREVKSVTGSTQINFTCGLQNSYTATGKAQIVRIPRYNTLTVNANADISSEFWTGTTGGVIAIEVLGNTTINTNGKITATGKGFRGGKSNENESTYGVSDYRSTIPAYGAEKGESIAGFGPEYDNLNGRYGMGAPANGGGGGNGHNCGGGGGANGGELEQWTGKGLPDAGNNNNYAPAWELEGAGFSTSVSHGGGKGGYSFSSNDMNALTTPLYTPAWGGDWRNNKGGLGGRPVSPQVTPLAFLGGGGGAGDQNDNSAGDGGNGGGLIYILSYGSVSGGGVIESNGTDGGNSGAGFITGKDGAGGGGGGGTIIVNAMQPLSNLTLNANGGKGGNLIQLFGNDVYGTGGGGGGGRIATSPGTVTINVLGGANGTTSSASMLEFPPQGATRGFQGVSTNTLQNFDITATGDTVCNGQEALLLAEFVGFTPPNTSLQWIDTANGGSILGTSTSLNYNGPVPVTLFVGACPGSFTIPVLVLEGGDNTLAGFTYTDEGLYLANFTNTSANGLSYLWDFGDGSTSTDENPSHQYISEGTYTVTLITTGNCGSDTITQQITLVKTGLTNQQAQALTIVAGADKGIYYVNLGSTACQKVNLTLSDLSGRTLQQQTVFYSGSGLTGPIDISTYSQGMYLLSIQCNNKLYYGKLIVN